MILKNPADDSFPDKETVYIRRRGTILSGPLYHTIYLNITSNFLASPLLTKFVRIILEEMINGKISGLISPEMIQPNSRILMETIYMILMYR